MSEDSFEKVKKGLKETAGGVEETAEGVAEGLVETAEGVKETAEGVEEGVEETAEGVEETAKGVAEGVEETAEKVTDSDTYLGSEKEMEKRDYNEVGGKEPMNREDIAAHEPTAVKRDQDTEIAGEGETEADSPEAREKFRKKGMTET
ncbi:MAG: hypothetical protein WAM19_02245 [Nitrososphaeraceae archaeon]